MFIPDPDFYPSRIPDLGSRIPDPKTAKKERGEKKFVVNTFLCSHKFHKIVNYFSFEVLKKKIWANFLRIIELFTKKIVKKLLKIWSWDPGSGKNLFWIPDPGSRGQKAPNPGSRIQHCLWVFAPLTMFLPCLQVTSSESLSNGESNSFPSSELMGAVIVEPAIEAALGKVKIY
jgi:hypothetical protein